MTRVLVFTLTLLLAATYIPLTEVNAGYSWNYGWGDAPLNFVWASSSVSTEFSFPYARSSHYANTYNASGTPGYRNGITVRAYYIFTSTIKGPEDIPPKGKKDKDWVSAGSWWWTSKNYSFNMGGKKEGVYTITGKSELTVKADLDQNGSFETHDGWNTNTFTRFEIE